MTKSKKQILLQSPPKLKSKLQLFSPCPDKVYMVTRKGQCQHINSYNPIAIPRMRFRCT